MSNTGNCPHCATTQSLDEDGRIGYHEITIRITKNVSYSKSKCPGVGKRPIG